MKGLELDGVALSVAGRALLGPLDVAVPPGGRATIMGPSGCGKSSLLAFIAGTLDPAFTATGDVRIDGEPILALPPERRRAGILFQDDLLFPHLSVGDNLAFALPSSMRERATRRAAVAQALAEADLAGFEARDPATLSGGQRARVAVMRTLLAAPRVLLLDEPFNKLDAQLRQEFRRFVFDHARDRALPVLLVTHDAADADAAGGPIIMLGA
ncbi:MAG TPA: ATP-binding cassette domain-containing protein [Casimicrobiaceae bacterium]